MKTLTRLIYVGMALMILPACEKKTALTQCAAPILTPSSGIGNATQTITVTITTTTAGAYLSWTDVPGCDPSPTNGFIIKDTKGDAITVYGRTLRAMAFKTGLQNSTITPGTYTNN
jgi:hypothetical protein